MPVSPFSRYRNLPIFEVSHATRGLTSSLPIRRLPVSPVPAQSFQHCYADYETADILALKYFGREDLYWYLLDANSVNFSDAFKLGDELNIPPLTLATRIERSGR